jgi:hypothetical protein
MAGSETSRALHNDRLTPMEIGAALGGPFRARKAAATSTPIVTHGYRVQFVISIIKNSQQKSPLQ